MQPIGKKETKLRLDTGAARRKSIMINFFAIQGFAFLSELWKKRSIYKEIYSQEKTFRKNCNYKRYGKFPQIIFRPKNDQSSRFEI